MEYRLTLLDNFRVKQGVGFELNVKLDVLPEDGKEPIHEQQKAFRFPIRAEDADILAEIVRWYEAQKDIHSKRIDQNNAQARLAALKEAVNRTEVA